MVRRSSSRSSSERSSQISAMMRRWQRRWNASTFLPSGRQHYLHRAAIAGQALLFAVALLHQLVHRHRNGGLCHLELLGDLADRHAGFAFGNELDHVHLVDGDVQPLFFQFVLLQDLHIAIDLHQKLVCFRRKAGHAAHSFRPFVPFFDKFS